MSRKSSPIGHRAIKPRTGAQIAEDEKADLAAARKRKADLAAVLKTEKPKGGKK